MSQLLDWLNSSLKDVSSPAFKNVVRVEDAEAESTGDGQVVVISDIKRVTLTLVTSTGEKKKLKTIAKLEAQTNAGKEVAALCQAFATEIRMYRDVLKSMEHVLSQVGDKEYLWAECYHTGENKLLFQDLCEEGYEVVPTHRFLDLDHSLIVMQGLGKFHGLSLVLKERSRLETDHFIQPYYSRRLPFMDQMYLKVMEKFAQSIKDNWGPEWSSVPERLLKYMEKPGELLHKAWESTKDKWTVLNHGDFSMRNMLFHYKPGTNEPDSVRFVDFQMCHYSNLGHDLATLLYSSVRPTVRDENLKSLLETYTGSLRATCQRHGYTGPLPTVEDVEESILSLAPVVIISFTFNIPLFVQSGKIDLQKKADEYFEKYNSCEEALSSPEGDGVSHFDFEDEDVAKELRIEMSRCLKQNIF